MATASTPTRIDVGFSQLENRSPAALPTGTRREAIAPTTVPSANGVSIEESAKTVSIARRSRARRGARAQRVGGAAEDDPDARR